MKLSSPLLSFLLNFLLGVGWAFAVAGAIITFSLYMGVSLIFAFFAALIGILPGLLFVLFIEYFFMKQEHLYELQKQSRLIEELLRK